MKTNHLIVEIPTSVYADHLNGQVNHWMVIVYSISPIKVRWVLSEWLTSKTRSIIAIKLKCRWDARRWDRPDQSNTGIEISVIDLNMQIRKSSETNIFVLQNIKTFI